MGILENISEKNWFIQKIIKYLFIAELFAIYRYITIVIQTLFFYRDMLCSKNKLHDYQWLKYIYYINKMLMRISFQLLATRVYFVFIFKMLAFKKHYCWRFIGIRQKLNDCLSKHNKIHCCFNAYTSHREYLEIYHLWRANFT